MKRIFIEKIRSSLSYKERKALVEPDNNLSIKRQCKLFSISRSSFYYKPKKPSKEDLLIMRAIDKQYLKTPFYGRRRMKEVLNRQGFKIGQKKVSSLMKKMNLRAIYPKEKTSIPNKAHKIYPYLLKDISITRANQVWYSDITYIPTPKGFMYLCVIMDWYSKKVMSWSLSNSLDVDFCVSSLERAIFNNGKPEIFNTDQGSQYTSSEFIKVLKDKDIKISMDSKVDI